jgi:DivIVA domain-containing protein
MGDQQETAPGLTAQDVHQVVFDRAGFVERGYNTAQVDAFLDRVATTIAELSGQIETLNEEIHRIRRWRQQVGAPVDAAPSDQAYAPPQRQMQALSGHAHLVAREVVARAQRQAAEIIQQARLVAGSVNGSHPDAGALHDRADDIAMDDSPDDVAQHDRPKDIAQHDRVGDVEQPGHAGALTTPQDPPTR